jgi:putative FmdB family regulatory protein
MPKYAFECPTCRLRFERNLRAHSYDFYPCPNCRGAAPLVVSEFGFSFAQGPGAPANSGVHDLDYPSADKAIGRNAGERWAHINARETVKKQAREQGQTHALIRHTGQDYVDYEPMSDQGRAARKALARETFKRIRGERG